MKKTALYILILLLAACKEKYDLPVNTPPTGYLVVEGVINSGTGATNINLSRTGQLTDNAIVSEPGANVRVEGEDNSTFQLFESGNGLYTNDQLFLNNTTRYRLHITTSNGKEYLSDFVEVKMTPPVDSISWKRENGGVQTYISAHDDQNKTRYYLWDYVETWEYHSPYPTSLQYLTTETPFGPVYSVTYRSLTSDRDSSLFFCWTTHTSTELKLGTSAKLTEDRIYVPLVYIEPNSVQLNVLYSINLRQFALTREAYEFLEKMKKNTEAVGSIFDPQPSELKGNIHCLTDPAEMVIGFVSVSSVEEKRIFISNDEVPDWRYRTGCYDIIVKNVSDSVRLAMAGGFIPTYPKTTMGFSIVDFYAAPSDCVDCTKFGSNIRPPFWP